MKTNLEKLHHQKTNEYFQMRRALTSANDRERRALEKASGKLFSELVQLGSRVYPTVHYSQF